MQHFLSVVVWTQLLMFIFLVWYTLYACQYCFKRVFSFKKKLYLNCIIRNLELLKLNSLDMISSMRFIRHLACASQLLLFYPRTRASLTRLIQMELALHGYRRKIFPITQKSLPKQVLLEDLTTTDAWNCMSLMVHYQFWFPFTFLIFIQAINHLPSHN